MNRVEAQRMAALERANETRFAIADIKRAIKAGRMTVAQALDHPSAARATIYDLLVAQKRWGRGRALFLLGIVRIREGRRIEELTEPELDRLKEALCR